LTLHFWGCRVCIRVVFSNRSLLLLFCSFTTAELVTRSCSSSAAILFARFRRRFVVFVVWLFVLFCALCSSPTPQSPKPFARVSPRRSIRTYRSGEIVLEGLMTTCRIAPTASSDSCRLTV
ncbi:hypothetical protein BIW11_12066, partial [Tropilaelaps mercedesae]